MESTNREPASSLSIRPLHPAIGAEVRGLDLRRPLDEATFSALQDAWMRHLVLVLPDQPVTDEQHIAFARRFGELERHHQAIIRSASAPEVFRVSNVDDDDQLMEPDHPTIAQINLARRWHTDSSFREVPSLGSILHGIEVTQEGGETCFTNMYAVLDALPPELAAKVRGRRARHDFAHLARLAPIKPLTEEEQAAMPPVWQPMVRRHPVTQRESLYISPIYNAAIDDMDEEESISLITELAEFAGRDEFVYRHRWSAHDIVMWDNRCTMHRVMPYDLGVRRVMHRTTVVGDGPVIAA